MAIPEEPPGDVAPLFALERTRLLELLATLGDEDWLKPSPCPEWTVLGLCCHLLGDDLSALARFRDQHHGTVPPEGLTEAGFIDWLDALQIEWVQAAKRLSPRLVMGLLAWAAPQLVDVFSREDPRSRSAHVSWAGEGLVPKWLHQLRELSEYWIHRQQLLYALGRSSDLSQELTGAVLNGLRWAYPYRLGQMECAPGDSVSIEISGPFAATWHIVATSFGWEFQSEPGPRLVAAMSLSTDQAWKLLTNNMSPRDQADLRLSGAQRWTDVLRRTRAIIGSPN